MVNEPITHLTLWRQCIVPPQGVASSWIFTRCRKSGRRRRRRRRRFSFANGWKDQNKLHRRVPAAWQQRQETRRGRGAPAEAKSGEGAARSAAQGGARTARRPAGAHSLWAGFTGSGEAAIALAAAGGLPEDLGVNKPAQARFKQRTGQDEETVTWSQLGAKEYMVFSAMPAVMAAHTHWHSEHQMLCAKTFSTLKTVFTEQRRSVLHRQKAHLIQLAPETSVWNLKMDGRRCCSEGSTHQERGDCNSTQGKSWLYYYLYCCCCLCLVPVRLLIT